MRNNTHKTAIIALTLAAFTLGTLGEAQARIGSSSPSSSRIGSPARTAPTSSRIGSSPSRIGGGSSMGMQRSSVMNSVRSQPRQAATPTPAQSYRPTQAPAPAPTPAPAAPNKRSWIAPAAAGVAAGALAGYALGHTNSPQAPQYQQQAPQYQQQAPQYQQPQQAPAYADQAPAYQQAAPAAAYQQTGSSNAAYAAPHSSGGFGFGSFLILALLAAAAFFAYRRYAQGKGDVKADMRRTANAAKASADTFKSSFNAPAAASAATVASTTNLNKPTSNTQLDAVGQDLMDKAESFYYDLQDLNNKGDLVELRNRVGDDDLYNGLADVIRTRAMPSQTEVISVQYSLEDITDEGNRYVGSVRYVAELREGANQPQYTGEDVFHFVKDKGVLSTWKLAGIEQV